MFFSSYIFSVLDQFDNESVLTTFIPGFFDFFFSASSLYVLLTVVEGESADDFSDEIFDDDEEEEPEEDLDDITDELAEDVLDSNVVSTEYADFSGFIFAFVAGSNISGILPFSLGTSSQIVLTFGCSFTLFFAINFIGIRLHGLNFLSLFLPSGAPLVMAFLLVPIELLSYFARVISLAVRLFANIMAGNCLLKILAGFCWAMVIAGSVGTVFSVLPGIIIFLICALELVIGYLQAYVFTLLFLIYLNDVLWLH